MPTALNFIPDRFVGGDDPKTVIATLTAREAHARRDLANCMNFLGAVIRENGGALEVRSETLSRLPAKFGITFSATSAGVLTLAVVPLEPNHE